MGNILQSHKQNPIWGYLLQIAGMSSLLILAPVLIGLVATLWSLANLNGLHPVIIPYTSHLTSIGVPPIISFGILWLIVTLLGLCILDMICGPIAWMERSPFSEMNSDELYTTTFMGEVSVLVAVIAEIGMAGSGLVLYAVAYIGAPTVLTFMIDFLLRGVKEFELQSERYN